MSQDLKALQVPQSTGKADSSQIDLTAAFNFTGTLQKSGTNLATTSDVTTGAQSESNLRTAAAALSASLAVNSQKITGLGTPSADSDAATKAYVDSVAAGLDIKASVVAATTANITLSGEQTIDGVSVVAGDRVLVKNQSTGSQNGIYIVAAGSWSRASDMAAGSNAAGAFTFVEAGGSVNAGRGYVVSSGVTVGTDSITWTQFSGGASYTAGDGIAISGGSIAVDLATDPGLEISGGKLRVKVDSSGVITRAAGGLNVQAATASQSGYQNGTQFGLTSTIGDNGLRTSVTTTNATPVTISLPPLSTSTLRRVEMRVAAKNTSDLTKSLYREIVFIARRGTSGNTVYVGSSIRAEIADANGTPDPTGMGAIAVAYSVGSGGSDAVTITGLAATNLSIDYSLVLSSI
jgi:hypothetical protein